MEEDKGIKIAATVLNVAGVAFGEIGNALKQCQHSGNGTSTRRKLPVTGHYGYPSCCPCSGVPELNPLNRGRSASEVSKYSSRQFQGGCSANWVSECSQGRISYPSGRPGSGVPEFDPFQGGRSANGVSECRLFQGGRSVNGVSEYSQQVPYLENIGGLHPDKMIFISGIPHPDASRFSVYLQQGDSLDPQRVAMVFDVRFKWGNPVSHNCVVMNHKEGQWDNELEERNMPSFPFRRGTEFNMIILVEHSCFKIAVNDEHFIEFFHRVEPGRIDTLQIAGDVNVTEVRIQD